MKKSISYEKQTYNSPNPIARFAHRSRFKASIELAARLLPLDGLLVDFGAGDGKFLHEVGRQITTVRRLAIEPYMDITLPGIERVKSFEEIDANTVDLITLLEVAEHLTDYELGKFLSDAKHALKDKGLLLITVPIMYGLALPVKELSRMMLHRRLSDTSIMEMTRGTFGFEIARAENRKTSHKGFDFRELQKEIDKHFIPVDSFYLPMKKGAWWVNSQAVFISEKRS
tara:strand:- start:219 stop:902 length:684 start_codon:yes stop_codon:yes gene_type:complete